MWGDRSVSRGRVWLIVLNVDERLDRIKVGN